MEPALTDARSDTATPPPPVGTQSLVTEMAMFIRSLPGLAFLASGCVLVLAADSMARFAVSRFRRAFGREPSHAGYAFMFRLAGLCFVVAGVAVLFGFGPRL